jgi:hypothetical protein
MSANQGTGACALLSREKPGHRDDRSEATRADRATGDKRDARHLPVETFAAARVSGAAPDAWLRLSDSGRGERRPQHPRRDSFGHRTAARLATGHRRAINMSSPRLRSRSARSNRKRPACAAAGSSLPLVVQSGSGPLFAATRPAEQRASTTAVDGRLPLRLENEERRGYHRGSLPADRPNRQRRSVCWNAAGRAASWHRGDRPRVLLRLDLEKASHMATTGDRCCRSSLGGCTTGYGLTHSLVTVLASDAA